MTNITTSAHLSPNMQVSASKWTGIGSALLLTLAFIGLDSLTYWAPFNIAPVAPWNPAFGLCVALALAWPRRAYALAFLGPIASAAINADVATALSAGAISGLVTGAETIAIVYGAQIVRKHAPHPVLKNHVAAILIAAPAIALAFGLVHAATVWLIGDISTPFGIVVIRSWIGDVTATVILVPLLTQRLAPDQSFQLHFGRIAEALVQGAIVGVTVWVAFGLYPETASRYLFIILLSLIWVGLRFGLRGVIVLNALVQACAFVSLALTEPPAISITLFQAIILILATSGLVFGLAVDQSRAATQQLRIREQELAASLRVAATGELAGTLAHELGHPLGAISNYAAALNHVLRRVAPDHPEVMSISGKLSQEIVRATDTLHRLRDFFRTGALALERTDIGSLVKDAVRLLKDRLGHNAISPYIVIQGGANAVLADHIQLRGVIYNLLINAIDALKSVPAESRILSLTVRRNAEVVTLEVEDSGPGVAPDVRNDIFEPMITTKKDGLGLGLAMSRSVVQAHGGSITLADSPLGGAKFIVTLPVDGVQGG
jgi:two-component system sensor kinase FixL